MVDRITTTTDSGSRLTRMTEYVLYLSYTMVDNLTLSQRKKTMASVRSKDTKPEMHVRKLTHAMGFRYRLHYKDLPGKPDLVFPSRNKVIFVHGCFWHQHDGCKNAKMPKSNVSYWKTKLENNKKRDEKYQIELQSLGWDSLIIWECETKDITSLGRKIRGFLEP